MAPPGIMTAVPPPPPEIMAQQAAAASAAAPQFAQMQAAQATIPDPLAAMETQLAKLESWAEETAPLAGGINPGLATLLVPIAQAGQALKQEVSLLRQKMAGPSPAVLGSVPPNVPGNIPEGRPAI